MIWLGNCNHHLQTRLYKTVIVPLLSASPQVTEQASEVPDHIRPNHLIKELTKEIRYLEVRPSVETRRGERASGCYVRA